MSLKIAIVAPTLRYVGGQSVQADLYLRHWHRDPEVEAIFVPIDPPLPFWAAWAKQVRGLRTLFREPFYFANLWRSLVLTDVAHIFASSYWSFLIAAAPACLIARLRGNKVLLHYHSGDARDHLLRFPSTVFVMGAVDELVVPTLYLHDVLCEFDLKPIVIPNLVDLSQFGYRTRHPLRPRFICTRGFSAYYNIDIVVRAFAEIKQAFPCATLDLLGEGPLEPSVRKLVADLALTDVAFRGPISRHDIGDYYDRADVFINASSVDAMPVSVIEAFRAGTPVVTTSPEAMRYLVEHERTGLLSPVGDAKALAANVVRLLHNAALAETLSRNAYQESLKYDWSLIRGQWLKQYRRLVRGPIAISGTASGEMDSAC